MTALKKLLTLSAALGLLVGASTASYAYDCDDDYAQVHKAGFDIGFGIEYGDSDFEIEFGDDDDDDEYEYSYGYDDDDDDDDYYYGDDDDDDDWWDD